MTSSSALSMALALAVFSFAPPGASADSSTSVSGLQDFFDGTPALPVSSSQNSNEGSQGLLFDPSSFAVASAEASAPETPSSQPIVAPVKTVLHAAVPSPVVLAGQARQSSGIIVDGQTEEEDGGIIVDQRPVPQEQATSFKAENAPAQGGIITEGEPISKAPSGGIEMEGQPLINAASLYSPVAASKPFLLHSGVTTPLVEEVRDHMDDPTASTKELATFFNAENDAAQGGIIVEGEPASKAAPGVAEAEGQPLITAASLNSPAAVSTPFLHPIADATTPFMRSGVSSEQPEPPPRMSPEAVDMANDGGIIVEEQPAAAKTEEPPVSATVPATIFRAEKAPAEAGIIVEGEPATKVASEVAVREGQPPITAASLYSPGAVSTPFLHQIAGATTPFMRSGVSSEQPEQPSVAAPGAFDTAHAWIKGMMAGDGLAQKPVMAESLYRMPEPPTRDEQDEPMLEPLNAQPTAIATPPGLVRFDSLQPSTIATPEPIIIEGVPAPTPKPAEQTADAESKPQSTQDEPKEQPDDDSSIVRPKKQKSAARAPVHQKTFSAEDQSVNYQEDLEKLLDSKIGSGYNKFARPLPQCSSHDCSHKIELQVGLKFMNLLSVDEKMNTVSMIVVLALAWPDFRLDFNVSEYFPTMFDWDHENDFLAVDAHQLWKPDVQLANSAEPVQEILTPRAFLYDYAKHSSHGYNVRMRTPMRVTVKCNLNMRMFPFDSQTCDFNWRAWSANQKWVTIVPFETLDHSMDNDKTEGLSGNNEEFKVTGIDFKQTIVGVDGLGEGAEGFPELVYSVHLKRAAHYYVASLVLPMFITVLLSVGVFYIDPPGGERLGFNITLFLTVMAVAFFTAERLPKNGGGDTWLERFQSTCYIVTIFPIFASLFCEFGRRQLRRIHGTGYETEWFTDYVDNLLRGPYAVITALLLWYNIFFIYQAGAGGEVSVQMLEAFLVFISAGLLSVGLYDIYVLKSSGTMSDVLVSLKIKQGSGTADGKPVDP